MTDITALSIPAELQAKLRDLSINTVEALASRLSDDTSAKNLQMYLNVSDQYIAILREKTKDYIVTNVQRNIGGALVRKT